MVQGTMSNAGKSVLTAALCRIFARKGVRVVPFKSQNMSLNSFATPDGGEIGRAQAVQAAAAMTVPTVQMNPILLKPEAERRSQVVVLGKATGSATAREYYERKLELWPTVTASLDQLRAEADLVVIEGAGGPAEINLRAHEIVNMRVARYANAPVLLVGDIDRGGVFASLIGTMELLEREERALVKGYVINKFRGDPTLLDSGLETLLERTGVPTLGILPYYTDIHIPEEDSLGLPQGNGASECVVDVAVIQLPHIANFDDFDPLAREPGVGLRFVTSVGEFGHPDVVILPGSKTTIADITWLESSGLAASIRTHHHMGRPVIGICAGYQMLGESIVDAFGLEGRAGEIAGLGLLPVRTAFEASKVTVQVEARVTAPRGVLGLCSGVDVQGYEIHMGRTSGRNAAPFKTTRRSGSPVNDADGAISDDGLVLGTYMHGLFHNRALRRGILAQVAAWKGVTLPPGSEFDQDQEFNKLADFVEKNLDMARLAAATGLKDLWP